MLVSVCDDVYNHQQHAVITLTSRYAELFAPSTKPSHDRTTGSRQELETSCRESFSCFLHARVSNFPQLIETYGLLEHYKKIITAVSLLNFLFTHCCLSCGLVATAVAAGST